MASVRKPSDLLDRDAAWQMLGDRWARARRADPQLLAVLGPRQSGKTWLTARLAASVGGGRYQFRGLAQAEEMRGVAGALGTAGRALKVVAAASPASWTALIEALVAASLDRPVLVVFDEVPYLSETRPTWARELQAIWDSRVAGRGARLMLVLVGSALRMMTRLVESGGPLFGRAERLHVAPFTLGEVASVRPDLGAVATFECYAFTGGFPRLVLDWQPADLATNLKRVALNASAPMLTMASEQLLHDGFGGISYRRILSAIASGLHRYSRIARAVELRMEEGLALLEAAGYVRRRTPVGSPPRARKQAEYRLTNPFLAFAWGPLARVRTFVEEGDADHAWELMREEALKHAGAVFEDAAREHVAALVAAGRLPRCEHGEWWTHGRDDVQIDIVGLESGHALFVGEAKRGAAPQAALAQLTGALARSPFAHDGAVRLIWTAGRGRLKDAQTFGVADLTQDLKRAAGGG